VAQVSRTVLLRIMPAGMADVSPKPKKSSWSFVGAGTRGCGRWDGRGPGSREGALTLWEQCRAEDNAKCLDGWEEVAKREMQLAILSEVRALTLAVLRSPCSTSLRGANPNFRAVYGEPCVLTPQLSHSGWGKRWLMMPERLRYANCRR
jgi:hypothetical protein